MGNIIRTEGVLQLERARLGHHAPSCIHQPISKSNHRENRTSIEPIEQQKLRTNRVKPYRWDRTALGDANESNEGGELLRALEFTHPHQNHKTDTRSIRRRPPIGGKLRILMEEQGRNARDSPDLAGLGWWGEGFFVFQASGGETERWVKGG